VRAPMGRLRWELGPGLPAVSGGGGISLTGQTGLTSLSTEAGETTETSLSSFTTHIDFAQF
jgi:hypothetical protein